MESNLRWFQRLQSQTEDQLSTKFVRAKRGRGRDAGVFAIRTLRTRRAMRTATPVTVHADSGVVGRNRVGHPTPDWGGSPASG